MQNQESLSTTKRGYQDSNSIIGQWSIGYQTVHRDLENNTKQLPNMTRLH